MAKIYRVSLIEEDGDEYGTLFELAGSPGMVGATAPAAITAALAEIGVDVVPGSVPVPAAVATAPLGTVFGGVTAPTKRTRRTKAEIAAAEQAQQEAEAARGDAVATVAAVVDEPTSAQVELAAVMESPAEQAAPPYDPFRQ